MQSLKPQDKRDDEVGWPAFWPEDVGADASAEAAEEVEGLETGRVNWANFNAKQQRKVCHWVEDPAILGTLFSMLECVLPSCKLMHTALKMSKMEADQIAAKGDETSESVDEEYLIGLRDAVSSYMATVEQHLHDMPALLHMQATHIPDLQLLAFKLLARGGASIQTLLLHQYLDMTPFSMMEAVARREQLHSNTRTHNFLET